MTTAKDPDGSSRKPRMLLVDDDSTLRHAMLRMLTDVFEVTAVPDAATALAVLDARFDVILSDYDMPHVNGVELLTQVRDQHPSVYRVLSSSGNVPELDRWLREDVAQRFLPKPVPRAELLSLQRMLIARATQ